MKVGRTLGAMDVMEILADLFETHGVPGYFRCDGERIAGH